MEAHDAFAQPQELDPANDPFATDDFADFEPGQGAPVTETASEDELGADAADLPIVNREMERIDSEPPLGAPEEAPALRQAPRPQVGPTPEAQAALDRLKQPQTADWEQAPTTVEPEDVSETSVQARGATPEQHAENPEAAAYVDEVFKGMTDPVADPTPQEMSERRRETSHVEPPQPPVSENGHSVDAAPASAAIPDETPPEDEIAAPPEEPTGKTGKVTKRRYLIFQVDGPGKLTQVTWYEDAKGKLTQRGAGAKRQSVVLARGTEDALKFGFAAVGAPQSGAHLVAVAALHFQPKKIKPAPPEPMRQRLTIT